jgi:hypothetical protein
MQPVFWKLSMGPGTAGEDFKTVLQLLDWVRRGVVLVHKDTKAKGTSQTSQGERFVEPERDGDYFYLCHGNNEPAVILLGQFVGPPNQFCERGSGWTERSFRWIRTSKSTKPYSGQAKWWAPNHNSTFIRVPDDELGLFEVEILNPYFDICFEDFKIR